MTSADDLVKRIEAAFPDRRPPLEHPLAESQQSEEPESVRQEFADKEDWTALSGAWLDDAADGWSSALSFLSDEAACFYIPAYLRADLRGELGRVDPLFHLVHGLDNASAHQPIWPRKPMTWNTYATRRWSRLTPQQCAVVCDYLEWRLATDDCGAHYTAAEALENYWRKRAG